MYSTVPELSSRDVAMPAGAQCDDTQLCAAEALLAAGAVGEAMAEFEALRRWDSLLLCLRLLDKGPQALDLIQRRLQACAAQPGYLASRLKGHVMLSIHPC